MNPLEQKIRSLGGVILHMDDPKFEEQLVNELEKPEHPVMTFAKAVLHGNQTHREWLIEAARCFIEGKPLPEPKA